MSYCVHALINVVLGLCMIITPVQVESEDRGAGPCYHLCAK